jgi:hypothetical protein
VFDEFLTTFFIKYLEPLQVLFLKFFAVEVFVMVFPFFVGLLSFDLVGLVGIVVCKIFSQNHVKLFESR